MHVNWHGVTCMRICQKECCGFVGEAFQAVAMKASLLALLALRASAESTNPLAKVIELLDGLKAKVTAEGEAEAKAYKEFFEWCDDAAANKGFEIKNDMLKQSLTDLIAADNKDKDDETAAKSAAEETKATAEGDLSNTVKDLADAQTCCGHLHSRCDHLRRCKCPASWLVWTRRTAMLVMRRDLAPHFLQ